MYMFITGHACSSPRIGPRLGSGLGLGARYKRTNKHAQTPTWNPFMGDPITGTTSLRDSISVTVIWLGFRKSRHVAITLCRLPGRGFLLVGDHAALSTLT